MVDIIAIVQETYCCYMKDGYVTGETGFVTGWTICLYIICELYKGFSKVSFVTPICKDCQGSVLHFELHSNIQIYGTFV